MDPFRSDLFAPARLPVASSICWRWCFFLPTWIVDVDNTFLNVPEPEDICVEPPKQWQEKQPHGHRYLWKLKKVLYGRRNAAQLWIDHAAGFLITFGFLQNQFVPTYC